MAPRRRSATNQLAQCQMRPADRERYGGPEWIDVERGIDALNDLDYEALVAVEDQLVSEVGTVSLTYYIATELRKISIRSERVKLWLGLLAAGMDIKLADFKPTSFNLDYRARPIDADPPVVTSDSSPASTGTTIPVSETSTSASTPGSGAANTA